MLTLTGLITLTVTMFPIRAHKERSICPSKQETGKCLHCLTLNLLPSIHSVCMWLKRPKDPSQCVSSSMPLPFIHHTKLGLTGKPTSWAWRSEVKQGEISRCRLLCSNTSAFQIHAHTVAHKQEVVWERCMWAQWQRLLVCIGGKFTCLCVCVFLQGCLRSCMWILKGCWPLKGSHLFDMFVFMLFSHWSIFVWEALFFIFFSWTSSSAAIKHNQHTTWI